MNETNERLGIEWIVACLQPNDIAPHPNFRTNDISAVQLFALILRFQSNEYRAYRAALDDDSDSSIDNSVLDIVDTTESALNSSTVWDANSRLAQIIANTNLMLGQRAAVSLMVATTDSELDQPTAHLALIDQLMNDIRDSTIGSSNSRRLAVASLAQQCALRASEDGQREKAREYCEQAVSTLSDINIDAAWDDFPVSPGIGWDAAESQKRIADLISGTAKTMLASSAGPGDNSWIDVVRSPFPLAAIRSTRDSFAALRREMDDIFKSTYAPTKMVQTLGKVDTTLRLLRASALSAELSGDASGSLEMRETLADVLSVRSSQVEGSQASYGTALRLFRQADANDNLTRLTQFLRMQGPLDILKESVERLINARSISQYVTSTDLSLINAAADLLSSEYGERAISLAELYASLDIDGRVKITHHAPWRRVEIALIAITVQLNANPDIHMDLAVTAALNIIAASSIRVDQSLIPSISRLTSAIRWTQVSSTSKESWRTVAENIAQSDSGHNIDRLRIYDALEMTPPTSVVDSLSDLENVTAVLGNTAGSEPTDSDLESVSSTVIGILDDDRKDAARGRFTGRMWSAFDLAAILIRDFSRDEIWPSLLASLRDPRTPGQGKRDALLRLTSDLRVGQVPDVIRKSLAAEPIHLPEQPINPLFSISPRELEVALRNFLLAYGLTSAEDSQDALLRDMGSPEVDVRSRAADGCYFGAIQDPGSDWLVILLMQLSHDPDSQVRQHAGRNLAYLGVAGQSALTDTIRSRVETLLADQGIALPIGVMWGLRFAARDGFDRPEDLWCRASISLLAERHMSWYVRDAARRTLEDFSEG